MKDSFWTTTEDTRVAAGMATLGVPVRVANNLMVAQRAEARARELRREEVTRFTLGLVSAEDATVKTKAILAAWRAGKMGPNDPWLTMMRGLENRVRLLDLAHQGVFCELREVPGSGPRVWGYVRGERGLPGKEAGRAYFKTGDLKLAAALGLAGCAVDAIEGLKGALQFYVRRYGPARGDLPRVDAYGMALEWRDRKESLPWADPVTQGLYVLANRERVLDVVNRKAGTLLGLLRGRKRVTIQLDGAGNAGDAAWEKAERWLG